MNITRSIKLCKSNVVNAKIGPQNEYGELTNICNTLDTKKKLKKKCIFLNFLNLNNFLSKSSLPKNSTRLCSIKNDIYKHFLKKSYIKFFLHF